MVKSFVAVAQNGARLARCEGEDEKQAEIKLTEKLSEEEFKPIYSLWEKNNFQMIQEG